MKDYKIKDVEVEMDRLSKCIEKYKERLLDTDEYGYASLKEAAAVRRSSMDLTRVLAELRKFG